ncbi:MAG: hypothetical protein ACFFDT_03380 [Candidatus Hodarchaeota archaeon]
MVILGLIISMIILIVFNLITSTFLMKNTHEMRWYKTYGGVGIDASMSLIQTTDGGFALAGLTNSSGAGLFDMWLVKTDVNGVTQWSKTYGGIYDDGAFSLIQTNDGGYALAGSTISPVTNRIDMWFVKIDANGLAQWNRTYGGVGEDGAFSLLQTTDGGYALAGSTSSAGAGGMDMWLVKTDINGVAQWNKTYGGVGRDMAWVLLQTVDGGFALAGSTNSSGTGEHFMWLVKTDVNGLAQWNRTYEGIGEFGVAAFQTVDGNYVLACNNRSDDIFVSLFNTFLVKTDVNGIPQWNQTYTDLFFIQFLGMSGPALIETMDGGIALVGLTFSKDLGSELPLESVVIKTDVNGTIQWEKTFKGVEKEINIGFSLVQTTKREFIVAGSVITFSDDISDIVGSDIWMGKLVSETNQLIGLEILPILIAICFVAKIWNQKRTIMKKYC